MYFAVICAVLCEYDGFLVPTLKWWDKLGVYLLGLSWRQLVISCEKIWKIRGAYYICKSNSTKTMDNSKSFGQSYLSPATQIIEIDTEGILCASGDTPTETLGENLGSWN